MNPITRTLNVDNLLLLALQEDISSEDVTTNAVLWNSLRAAGMNRRFCRLRIRACALCREAGDAKGGMSIPATATVSQVAIT